MNEKVKKALRIAGIVGICALLFALGGGLGYCSAKRTGEPTKVLTERSRKNAKGTTSVGGYEKITFSVTISHNSQNEQVTYYTFDQNYDLVTSAEEPTNTFYLQTYSEGDTYTKFYWSLINANQGTENSFPNFILLNSDNKWIKDGTGYRTENVVLVSYGASYSNYSPTPYDSLTLSFQDIASYYLEQGYNEGYDEGELDGYEDGFEAGSGTGKMFTALGVNTLRWYRTNLTATDSTDTTVTYRLLTFKDGNNQTWSVYATNYIASLDRDNLAIDLFQGSTASSANRRLTLGNGTETYLGSGIWDVQPKDYATFTFAQIVQVYNNSLVENYFLMEGIPANATGYDMGYQKGWNDGYNASPGGQSLDNVFTIFTKAFEATASFFNIKVFGFLPLYWFFLIPIFVAIVTLLMRMIKH